MLAYTIRRILLVIPTLLAVAVLVFFVLRVVPGDIVEIKLAAEGGIISAEEIQKEKERLGLDDPILSGGLEEGGSGSMKYLLWR